MTRILQAFAKWFASAAGVWQTVIAVVFAVILEVVCPSVDSNGFWLLYWLTVYSAITQPALAYVGYQAGQRTDVLLNEELELIKEELRLLNQLTQRMGGTPAPRGLDYAGGRPSGASIAAAGYSFVCRYMSDGGDDLPGKLLLPGEVADLHANGISIVLNWETTGTTFTGGYNAGVVDAQGAVQTGIAVNSPVGSVVYFSIDEDAQPWQYPVLLDYFRGINSVIGVAATGVYGGEEVVKCCLDAGVVSWAWQTQAWSDGNQDPRINILQDNNAGYAYVDGVECDIDIALTANFGQWAP